MINYYSEMERDGSQEEIKFEGEGNEEILSAIGLSAAEIDEITRTVSGTREALLALLAANQPQN